MTPTLKTVPTVKNPGTAAAYIAVASSQVGFREGDNNDNPYGVWYGLNHEAWCFTGETLVMTPDGYKTIDSLTVGSLVLDKDQAIRTVVSTMSKLPERLLQVKMEGAISRVTPEHPYWARKLVTQKDQRVGYSGRRFSEPEWVPAGELRKGDQVAIPIDPEPGGIDVDPDLAYIIGRWVGDGWLGQSGRQKRVMLCCSYEKTDELEAALLKANLRASRSDRKTVVEYQINSKILHERLLDFYSSDVHRAHTKRISGEVFNWANDSLVEFLRGYSDADGCYYDTYLSASSVSRELVYGLATLYRSLGNVATINNVIREKTCVIQGRTVNQRDSYTLTIRDLSQSATTKVIDSYQWVNVKKVIECEPEIVYDIEVETTHSFIADGVAVHNCAIFQSWVAAHSGAIDIVPRHAYTPAGADWFRGKGQWGHIPKVGALAYFYSSSQGRIHHVAVVAKVNSDGTFITVEGNTNDNGSATGNGVYMLRRSGVGGSNGGFGYPKFKVAPVSPPVSNPQGLVVAVHTLVAAAEKDPARSASHSSPWAREAVKIVEMALVSEKLMDLGQVDGRYGTIAKEAYKKWQVKLGYKGADADGVAGFNSLKALGAKHGFEVIK